MSIHQGLRLAWEHVSSDCSTAQQPPGPRYLPGSCCQEPSTGCTGAPTMTQDWSPILLLRGSSGSELAREEGGRGGPCPSPFLQGQLCGGRPPQGPNSPLAGQTKTSLSSAGVGHQREGRRGRSREEGGKAGQRRQEGQRRGGTERGRRKSTDLHTRLPPGSGHRDC